MDQRSLTGWLSMVACVLMVLACDMSPSAAEDRRRSGQRGQRGEAAVPRWPMYRGNPQRTGHSPFRGPGAMRVEWEVDLKREICASPVVAADGTIYLGAGALFYAITPAGELLWTHNFADSGQAKPPKRDSACSDNQAFTSPSPALAADGTLYQNGGMGNPGYVMAFESSEKADQRVRWAFKTTTEMRSSPLLSHGTLFVADSNERLLMAIDGDGKLKWQFGQAGLYASGSSPAMSADLTTIYVGALDGRLHAVDAATGQLRWTAGPEGPRALRLPQSDAQGKAVRGFTTAGHIPEGPAVGPDGTVYFGSWDGHLYAAASNGKLLWSIDLEDRVTSAPAVSDDGRILVSTYEGTLYAIRVVGGSSKVDWQAEANSRYSSPLISADAKVYVGSLDGKLRTYALETGDLLGELALDGWIHASPVPGGDGVLYVGTSDGRLRAIGGVVVDSSPAHGSDAEKKATAQHPPRNPHNERSPREVPAGKSTSAKSAENPWQSASDFEEAVRLARAYLEEADVTRREAILQRVGAWSERLDEIALALRPTPPANAHTGYIADDRFMIPRVRARMAELLPKSEGPVLPFVPPKGSKLLGAAPGEEHLNYVYVPEDYSPSHPLGLLIDLHGGAGSSQQSSAREMQESKSWGAKFLHRGGFISVCPSTPPQSPRKFSFPESDVHFQSIIEEYSSRYAIDPDRVYLTGFSMGGIGSWWQAFRQADRFALIAPRAGWWTAAYWPKLRGTLLFYMNGAFDYTIHIDYTRYAHEQLKAFDVPHIDAEYLGAHSAVCSVPQREALFELIKTVRRDPYCSRACAVSPFVLEGEADRYPPQPHSFWVSVMETGPDGILADYRSSSESRVYEGGTEGNRSWRRKAVAFKRRLMKAGAVDAENLGDNRFRVKVTNVRRFALRLHPKMDVDFTRPIEIELIKTQVDAEKQTETELQRERITATAKPSLGAMLEYLGERRDYGLIYHAIVEVDCGPRTTGHLP